MNSGVMCSICGKGIAKHNRPYQYDSGDITMESVCDKCEKIHSKLTKKESNLI